MIRYHFVAPPLGTSLLQAAVEMGNIGHQKQKDGFPMDFFQTHLPPEQDACFETT